MKRFLSGFLAAGLVLALSTGAGAITMGSIPGSAANQFIQPYGPLFGGPSVAGYFGAQIYLSGGPADLKFDYFGAEAGYHNEFNFNGSELFDHPGGIYIAPNLSSPLASTTVLNVSSGLLNFSFDYNNDAASVVNGSNPDDSAHLAGPNFFVSFNPINGIGGPTSGQFVYLFLDDGGAGPDDNHDDMLVRISIVNGDLHIVPEPGTLLLLGTGLFGVGLMRRRQQNRRS